MVKRLGLVAAAVAVIFAMTGCEPSMTITAKDDAGAYGTSCGLMIHVNGNVTPISATPKVVLQTTKGGKWVDAQGRADWNAAPTTRTANVSKSTGGYSIPYVVDWYMTSKHLRVRSAGGGSFSPSFYVKSEGVDGSC
jgi:hypothetical protein